MRWSKMLNVVECRVGGEVGRVVPGGMGDVPGETIFEKKIYLEQPLDALRKLLLFEPRGGMVHSANFVLPSRHPEARLGYVIAESTEYPAMSGSNTICTATVLLETGMIPMTEPVTELILEAPAGLIRLRCECRDGKVTGVRFTNRPAFAYHLDAKIEVEGLGTVTAHVAWGGMAYAIVSAPALGFSLTPDEGRDLCVQGQLIKRAAAEQRVGHRQPLPQQRRRADQRGPVPGGGAQRDRAGVDHRALPGGVRPERSFPRRIHAV